MIMLMKRCNYSCFCVVLLTLIVVYGVNELFKYTYHFIGVEEKCPLFFRYVTIRPPQRAT